MHTPPRDCPWAACARRWLVTADQPCSGRLLGRSRRDARTRRFERHRIGHRATCDAPCDLRDIGLDIERRATPLGRKSRIQTSSHRGVASPSYRGACARAKPEGLDVLGYACFNPHTANSTVLPLLHQTTSMPTDKPTPVLPPSGNVPAPGSLKRFVTYPDADHVALGVLVHDVTAICKHYKMDNGRSARATSPPTLRRRAGTAARRRERLHDATRVSTRLRPAVPNPSLPP